MNLANLTQNVLAQMKEMHMMAKRPQALRIDRDSLDALIRELGTPELLLPGARLFGLQIEVAPSPDFEVV